MKFPTLDKVDQKIIEILSKNARTSSREIASEVRKIGFDMHDRNIRKRISRMEQAGIIKSYKAITDTIPKIKYKIIYVKLKPSKSNNFLKKSIHQSLKKHPQFLMSAETNGDWDILIVASDENSRKDFPDALGKFTDEIKNYSVDVIDFTSLNTANLVLLLLNKEQELKIDTTKKP